MTIAKKKRKNRKREFIKQRRIIRMSVWILFGFILVLAHMLVFTAVSGKPFDFANASDVVKFNQSIRPINPVEKTEPIKREGEKKKADLHSSNFRIITPLVAKESAVSPDTKKIETAPVVTFGGTALYPNATVFLAVHSHSFFSSTLSDNQGHWTWTNFGHPLEPGDHSIMSYSIAPTELAGKRDILAQKYSFTVAENSSSVLSQVSLGNSQYEEKSDDDDLEYRIRKNDLGSTYVFQAALPNKSVYGFGDNMDVELLFIPLGRDSKNQASIDYSIYALDVNGNADTQPAAEFSDLAQLDDGGYFLKSITLKDNMMPGSYVMKISAKIGQDEYIQSLKFDISSKALMTIGSNVITVEKFGRALVFNVIFIVVILIGLVALIIVEFRRFMVYRPIDESMLKRKGYFTK